MYSRAARTFPVGPGVGDASVCNPDLGPATYTIQQAAIPSRPTAPSYAPFSTLTPKISYFDTLITTGPSPLTYGDVAVLKPLQKKQPAALFGASHSTRFKESVQPTPGPGQYTLASSLHIAPSAGTPLPVTKYRKAPVEFGPLSSEIVEVEAQVHGAVAAAAEPGQQGTAAQPPTPTGEAEGVVALRGQHIRKTEAAPATPAPSKEEGRARVILWKRKHIPPSIPRGNASFGYKETSTGELVPRKLPVRRPPPTPEHLLSFVERDKHEARGFAFAKSGQDADRLQLAGRTGIPGPGKYDAERADTFLREKNYGKFVPVMSLAPSARMADQLLHDTLKQSVPGPGAYDTPIIHEAITTKKNRILAPNSKRPKNKNRVNVPGPGQYYPELSGTRKPVTVKVKPFGSNAKRFTDRQVEVNRYVPAPGNYEVEAVTSLASRVQQKLVRPGVVREKLVLGSMARDRFQDSSLNPKNNKNPGPGAYEVVPPPMHVNFSEAHNLGGPSTVGTKIVGVLKHAYLSKTLPHLRNGLASLEDTNGTEGGGMVDAVALRLPVFGSQSERFHQRTIEEVHPPPGSYDISDAFEAIKKHGLVKTSSLRNSKTRRVLFKRDKTVVPGPGQYDPALPEKQQFHRHPPVPGYLRALKPAPPLPITGAPGPDDFDPNREARAHAMKLAAGGAQDRFAERPLDGPGPEAYTVSTSLVRKTYNVTLGKPL